MSRETNTWFEIAADGEAVEIKTFFASRLPGGEPGFSVARVDRLKAFHLALTILSVIAREMRTSGVAFDLPGVTVERTPGATYNGPPEIGPDLPGDF